MKLRTALGILLGMLFAFSLSFQAWQLYKFVGAGQRFTAKDGQELCLRVRDLEDPKKSCRYSP